MNIFFLFKTTTNAQYIPSCLPSDKILVCWPFNGNVNDTFGKVSSTPYDIQFVEDRNGNPGKAVYFNGLSSMIKTNFHKSNITEYTISAWVKIPENGHPTICNHRNVAGKGVGFNLFYDGFGIDGETSFRIIRSKNITELEKNKWYHITGVWKGINSTSVETNQMKIYINGRLITDIKEHIQGNPYYCPVNADTVMTIGRHFSWNHWFKGALDDLIIFDYALTPFQVKLLYQGLAIISQSDLLLANRKYNIKWLKNDTIKNVNLSYSIDNGKTWATIANNISDCNYLWLVPDVKTDSLIIRAYINDSIFDQTNCMSIVKEEDGLLLYYPLNGNANNEFSNNYHGIEYNLTDTTDISGFIKSSKYFDSDEDSLVVSSNGLRTGNEGTILMWIKANNYNINESFMIISNRKGTNIQQFYLNLHQNPAVGLHFRYGNWNTITDRIIVYPTSRTWEPDSWHHVAIRWKRENSTTYLTLFVDGQNVGSNSTPLLIDDPANWIIGGAYESNHAFRGAIDEVRIYNKAISDQLINKIYLSGMPYQFILPEEGYDVVKNTMQTIKIKAPSFYPDNINIDFSLNNGKTWNNITSNFNAEDDSIIWIIPNTTSDLCLFRLSRAKYPEKYYIQKKTFRIVENLLEQNLIAYYPLDSNELDYSGYNNHALIFNGKNTKGIYGINKTAYNFDGKTGFMQLPNISLLKSSSFTLSCWIKTNEFRSNNDFKKYPYIFSIGASNNLNNGFIGITTTNGFLAIWSKSKTSETLNIITEYYISDNQWHNIICSYDGDLLRIYFDGQKTKYSLKTSLKLSDCPINLMSFRKDSAIGEYHHEGSIDDVRLYKASLDDNAIKGIYQQYIVITQPKDNSNVVKNTKVNINWKPNDNFKNIGLYYSMDRGIQWNVISENIQSGNAYLDWTVPNTVLDSVIIKLKAINKNNNKTLETFQFINILKDSTYLDLLEAWFPFDNDYNDYSGNNHSLIINGTELKTTNDRPNTNKACYLDGLTDYLIIPGIFCKPFRSFSFWYKSSSTSGTLLSFGYDNYLSLNNTMDEFPGRIYLSYNSNIILDSEYTNDDMWHFAVVNVDTNKIYLFIDNKLVGSKKINFYYNDTNSIKIGQHNQKLRFKGYIDDVRIYNRFMSEKFMSKLFDNKASNINIRFNTDDIKFYPNPVEDILYVNIPKLHNNVFISIYTISGVCVSNMTLTSTYNSINLKHLPKGIYILKTETDGITRHYKIIKK